MVLCFGTNACIPRIKDGKTHGIRRCSNSCESLERTAGITFISMLGYIHRLYLVKRQRNLKYS